MNRIADFLSYDPQTGDFSWIKSPGGRVTKGSQAGRKNPKNGYIYIRFQGKDLLAHRLAWFLQTGVWPSADIDHRDRNRSNNTWRNLREGSRSQNLGNREGAKQFKGEYHHLKRWKAQIGVGKKTLYLGLFSTPEEAAQAYDDAALQHYGEFAVLNLPRKNLE